MANDELFSMQADQSKPIDIKRIVLHYLRYWYLFLIGALLGVGLAYFYLHYYAVPQYSVYSTILIKDDKSGQNLSSTDALNDLSTFKTTRNIDNEIEVIKSKSLMARVVKELDLYTSYYTEGRIKDKELYGSTLPIKLLIDKEHPPIAGGVLSVYIKPDNAFDLADANGLITHHKFGQQLRTPYGTFTVVATTSAPPVGRRVIVRFQNIEQVADYYNRSIGVQPINKSTSILYLSLTDPIPAKAKDILNKLTEVYNREAIEDKSIMTNNTLKFLDERLRYLTNDLSDVEKTVEDYKSANGLTDVSTQASSYNTQASSYNSQISELAIRIDVLASLENYLKRTAGQYVTVPSTLGIQDETLMGLIGKFNEIQLERERMLRTTEPGNILVQNMNEQLANLRVNILENLRNIKRGLQITSTNLKASSGQFQTKIKQVPGMERELLKISRQQSIKQHIYSYLLQKREETALALAATGAVSRVLDPALGGDFPISPNGRTIYLMALLLGLGVPFAGIYASTLLNNKVQSQQDVLNVITVPILGEIVHNSSKEIVVVTQGSRSPIAEMFRLIRTNLNFAAIGRENLVILTTSSMSGEGKTFFCINLAASLALTSKRVLLIDLDLRNPKVSKELELPKGLGVTDYLINNQVSIDEIIHTTNKAAELSIISSGPIPPNPAELIMSAKFTDLIGKLKRQFDYIIIDTPPVGKVADSLTLNHLVDFTVYLVRYDYTEKGQLEILKNIYKDKTLNNPMVVLNDAKESNGSNYGYGYGYGYEQSNGKSKREIPKKIQTE